MSELRDSAQDALAYQGADAPAVGIVATPDQPEAVVADVLQAQRHGLDAFVHANGRPESEAVELARFAGARIVERGDVGDGIDPRTHLRRVARREGYPGLIYSPEADRSIDLERSLSAVEDGAEYVSEATYEATVDREARLLAAIPAYNEAGTIGEVVEETLPHVDDVLVVDDGSKDGTSAEAAAAGATVLEHWNSGRPSPV